jgi:saccharopine dehydrogenase-like NADP-dependent oxidoreductase
MAGETHMRILVLGAGRMGLGAAFDLAQMMARSETKGAGAIPQERSVPPERFVAELAARNIRITDTLVNEH